MKTVKFQIKSAAFFLTDCTILFIDTGSAEFNFKNDVDAAFIILNSKIRPMTIYPFNANHMEVSVV